MASSTSTSESHRSPGQDRRPSSGTPQDDAALAASELYTKALWHGPADGQVLADCWLWPTAARIVVADGGGTGTPRPGRQAATAEGGGLLVVKALAGRFGSFRLPAA